MSKIMDSIMDNSLCIRFNYFNFFQIWKQKKHLVRFLLFYCNPDTISLFNPWKSVLDMTLIFLQEQMQIS